MSMKQTLQIRAVTVHGERDYMPLARHLMDRIIAFYEDPENVKAFEEWKKQREARKA